MGKFQDEVETGRLGSTEGTKEGPIDSSSGDIRPVVRFGNVSTKGSIEVEVANGCGKTVSDTVLVDRDGTDSGREKRSDCRRGTGAKGSSSESISANISAGRRRQVRDVNIVVLVTLDMM